MGVERLTRYLAQEDTMGQTMNHNPRRFPRTRAQVALHIMLVIRHSLLSTTGCGTSQHRIWHVGGTIQTLTDLWFVAGRTNDNN